MSRDLEYGTGTQISSTWGGGQPIPITSSVSSKLTGVVLSFTPNQTDPNTLATDINSQLEPLQVFSGANGEEFNGTYNNLNDTLNVPTGTDGVTTLTGCTINAGNSNIIITQADFHALRTEKPFMVPEFLSALTSCFSTTSASIP